MTRLFNFERKEQITDITGNLYDRSTILSIINRLSCFGIILVQLIEKRNIDYKSNLGKIHKKYELLLKKRDEEYDVFEEKVQHILDKYNELNPEKHINYLGHKKKIFTIEEHYTEEQKIWFKEQKITYEKAEAKYNKIDEESDLYIKKHEVAFDTENDELWTDVVFFKFIKIINPNKYLVEVSPYFYGKNLNSGLKIGDTITINPLDISYVNPIDNILEKYRKTNFSSIHNKLDFITDCNGTTYKNIDRLINLLETGDTVRVSIEVEDNDYEDDIVHDNYFCKIVCFDSSREWFLGLSLWTNSQMKYDYEDNVKDGCLYYFHRSSICHIDSEFNKNKELIEKELTGHHYSLSKYKKVYSASNFKVNILDVLPKFIVKK